jgi:hypothetical protein
LTEERISANSVTAKAAKVPLSCLGLRHDCPRPTFIEKFNQFVEELISFRRKRSAILIDPNWHYGPPRHGPNYLNVVWTRERKS